MDSARVQVCMRIHAEWMRLSVRLNPEILRPRCMWAHAGRPCCLCMLMHTVVCIFCMRRACGQVRMRTRGARALGGLRPLALTCASGVCAFAPRQAVFKAGGCMHACMHIHKVHMALCELMHAQRRWHLSIWNRLACTTTGHLRHKGCHVRMPTPSTPGLADCQAN